MILEPKNNMKNSSDVTSPFQTKEYLDLFARHFVKDTTSIVDGVFEILPDKKAILLGMKSVLNGQEITDYGDLPGIDKHTLLQKINRLHDEYHVTSVRFDNVREQSLLFQYLSELIQEPPRLQEVAPKIALPKTWEEYLESLERIKRKELKRKWKRLETVPYEFRLINPLESAAYFEAFIRLHSLSDFTKEQFMTDPMKAFFKDLLTLSIPGCQQKLAFLYINNEPVASVFYFENEQELLLYNSGYDPVQKYYSVGLLLIAHLIQHAIVQKKTTFDFLRGNERYKYDLGGKEEKLYQFTFLFSS